MDYTFGFAALFGLVLTIVTYRTPKAVFLRDGLGKGDTGNRMLLIAVPGLTVLSLGVQLFEILDGLTRGLSPWRVWGLPFAVLLIVIGLGVTLWAFIPGPAPRWLQPRWMQEQTLQDARLSLARVDRAQNRRDRSVKRRGFEYFSPQVIDDITVAYPENWVLDLGPTLPFRVPGLRLGPRFAVVTPHDFRPRARFLLCQAPAVGGEADAVNWLRRLAVPAGWEVDRVEPAHLAGSPGIFAQTRQPDGKGVQQRWVTAAGDSIWLAAFQVGAPDFGDFAGLGPKIAATLTLPGSV